MLFPCYYNMRRIITYPLILCVSSRWIPQFQMNQNSYGQTDFHCFHHIKCNVAVSYHQFESKLVLWEVACDCVDLDSLPVKSAKLYVNDIMVTHTVYPMNMHIFISLLFYFCYIIGSQLFMYFSGFCYWHWVGNCASASEVILTNMDKIDWYQTKIYGIFMCVYNSWSVL